MTYYKLEDYLRLLNGDNPMRYGLDVVEVKLGVTVI